MHTKTRFAALAALLLLLSGCGTQSRITLESLLDEMVSPQEAARYPDPLYACRQESSYDRLSDAPGSANWFANSDGFGVVRTDTVQGRIEKVLFDQSGPGVITRIWITTLDKRGTWRFYFDGASEPGYLIPAYDLMLFGIPALGKGLLQAHTSYTPEGKGGNTLFLPIPYAQSCKITFEDTPGIAPTPKYYHINYRQYPAGTSVETFSKEVIARAMDKIASTDKLLLNPPPPPSGTVAQAEKVLQPGESLTVTLPEGENAVYEIDFNVKPQDASSYAQCMRQLIFRAEFDKKQTVWVPLSDFSGGGMGAPLVKSWFLNADGEGQVQSRWLMPYKKSGVLTLENISDQPVEATVKANVSALSWDSRSLYFYASWRQERGIYIHDKPQESSSCIEWNFARLKGKGVYKGDLLSLYNHAPAWYGEGDEKIWVDKDTFPSHFGTGTEDYYNSSWAPVVPFHTPFGGAPRADLASSHGYNAFFRTRNLDGIPFGETFRFDIEMLGWIKGTADYATTIYWYGTAGSEASGTSGAEEAKQPLLPVPPNPADYRIDAAGIEFEELAAVEKSPNLHTGRQDTQGFTGKWSRAGQLLGTNGNPGDYVTFRLSNLENRPYQPVIYATKAADYGIVSFIINDKTVAQFDGYNKDVVHAGPLKLGKVTPKDGCITFRVQITGTNKQSVGSKYMFGLDCIILK